jgi:uncharacterized protein
MPCCALLLAFGLAGCHKHEVRHWPTGAVRSEGRVQRWTGVREGLWTFYYPTGVRREEGRLEGGAKHGRWREWHSTGQPRAEGSRQYDPQTHTSPRQGQWVLYYEDGSFEARGVYRAGKREGHWDYYRHDGSLDPDLTGEYHNDQRLE